MKHWRTSFAIAVACAGCAEAPTVARQTQQVGGDGGCPVWGCGSNSPIIDAIEFFDTNERGLYNDPGFRIVRFEKYWANAWRQYRPDVKNGELLARNLATGAIVHEGPALIGARFELYNKYNELSYYLIVAGTKEIPIWARTPDVSAQTRAYHLVWSYKEVPKLTHEVCGESGDNDGLDPFHAVLFDDDRIDAEHKKVTDQTRDWFNIGCKGHALAKQHLTGHTKAASTLLGITTSLDERTANLKMITGDYCGTGRPFTQPHVPLHWKYASGIYDDVLDQVDTVEARWTAQGAACLEKARVDVHPPNPNLFEDDVEVMIETECERPPVCEGTTMDLDGAFVLSANPP